MKTYTNEAWKIRVTVEVIKEPNGGNTYRARSYQWHSSVLSGTVDFGNLGEAEHYAETVSGKSAPDEEVAR